MKIIIFAGGTGRRLWPISRKHSPKQFEPLLGERSTLQMAVDRVRGSYGAENIYISTNERYQETVREQLPELPPENIIGEPVRRDLAPAVGLSLAHLAAGGAAEAEPVTILWGDNYMTDTETFLELLQTAETLLAQDDAGIIFIGETPRFANENLGWIGLGEQKRTANGRPAYAFETWRYRPPREEAEEMFESGQYVWNTGYFVTTVGFVRDLYREHRPEMAAQIEEIEAAIGQEAYEEVLHRVYPQMDVISFDDAILTHVAPEQAMVLHGEMGWSDPGTLYALKEALASGPEENVTDGLVLARDTQDSLLVNEESDKLLAVIGLDGMIVVNTKDAILVVHKDRIPEVKQLVNDLQDSELEQFS
ncbi:MAG: sugar phosphate nucleotidyltransferase [Candidatus Promineifilaceae bacterium]|nr:sugar phosphate nucleotidyltransferase [Candidatus Promineifilaceae bacterium]